MDKFCVYIKMDDYLAQWFIHEQGGENPVNLIKGSIESKFLELALAKWPENVTPLPPDPSDVAIVIPFFRTKPPYTYNYLSKRSVNAIIGIIRNRFDVELWKAIHSFGRINEETKEIIYAWMENNGIEDSEKNWNAIAKRYQRLRAVYLSRKRSEKAYSMKKKSY